MTLESDDPLGSAAATLRAVQQARPGEHLCSFHAADADRFRLAAAFVASALATGDQVIYVGNEHAPDELAGTLAASGLDVGAAVADGRLEFVPFAEMYGPANDLDLDGTIARYAAVAARSRAQGYPGLRVAVEMGDFDHAIGGVDPLAGWERLVTRLFLDAGVVGLCQYDEARLGFEERVRVTAEHHGQATDDGSVPLASFAVDSAAGPIRVTGALDLASAPAFARVLRARAAVEAHVEVDLAAVSFAGVAGLRTIFEVAAELPPDGAIVLREVPDPVQRTLGLLGWRDRRVHGGPS